MSDNNNKKNDSEAPDTTLELFQMALLIKLAQFITRLTNALDDAFEARREAHRRHPHVPEE